MDPIQEYQSIKQAHREAELKVAKAKAQREMYQKDIESILASENVSSVEELASKYQSKLTELESITAVLKTETEKASAVLAKLGMN